MTLSLTRAKIRLHFSQIHSLMTTRELLFQEIATAPDELLTDLLSLVKSFKTNSESRLASYTDLLDRINYLEAIIGIRKGLEEFDRNEGIPADQAFLSLQQTLNIPPR
ncbi:MAG: hypothetical protein KME35_10425 [Aphanocapsa sp. GSE-SYN-MK-11-07L]|nr:hypothetical protein [Aphanocapsa sp. GSE-SYN-MK-11-07L]